MAVVLGLSAPLLAGAAKAETLDDALIQAYEGNPQILAERANLRRVDEGVPQALAGWRPTVTFTGQAGRQNAENVLSTSPNSGTSFTDNFNLLDLKITQPVYKGGGTVAQTAAAEASVSAERARNVATEGTVFLAVITSYFDTLRDTEIVDIDKATEQTYRDMLTVNTGRWHLGELTRTDVVQTEGRAEDATAQRAIDEGALQGDREAYAHVVGHLPGTLTEPTLKPVIAADRDQAVALAATHNPTVIGDTFDELSEEHTVDVNRAKLLPTVSIIAEGQRGDGNQLPDFITTNGSVMAQLQVPLYESGSNWSMTRQAIQAVAQAKATTDDARKQAVQSAGSAWQTIVASRKGIAALEKAVVADKLSVQGMQAEQLAGTRTIVDVLNAEQQLYTDQISLAKTQHDLHVAEYTLSQQIGRLTALDLKLNVKLYDARVHYDSVRNKWFGLDSTDR